MFTPYIQSNANPVETYGEQPTLNDRDFVNPPPSAIASFATLLILGMILWAALMLRVTTQAGYKGMARWIWFALLALPGTMGWSLIVFILVPWPAQRELKKLQQQKEADDLQNQKTQMELNKLRRYLSGATGDPEIDELQQRVNEMRQRKKASRK